MYLVVLGCLSCVTADVVRMLYCRVGTILTMVLYIFFFLLGVMMCLFVM